MKKRLYKLVFFDILKWSIIGSIDPKIKKCVMMVMPHTSWHDFYLGGFTRGILGLDMSYVAKKELFDSIFGFYFRYMGGEPIDRVGGKNKVEAIAEIFERREVFRLAVSPEGTRKKVTNLKSGFYYIALKANVPIIPVAFDFATKRVIFGKPLLPTGNYDADLKILENHFDGVIGKVPEFTYDIQK